MTRLEIVITENGGDKGATLVADGKEIIGTPLFLGEACNAPIIAALIRVAGDLLVAEYENEHSVLNDSVRARNQAEAFAAGFRKMTEGTAFGAAQGPASIFDPPTGGVAPCPKCGHMYHVGQTCLNCEMLEEEPKGNKPDGQ